MTGGAGLLPCPDCGCEFRGKVWVSLHRRRAHPEACHQDHVPEQRKKARWVYEEKVLLARVEENTVEVGIAVNSNTLAEQFPSRSSEAIKKMRQSAEYKRILESLSGMHGMKDGPAGGSASSLAGATRTHDSRVDGVIPLKPMPPSVQHRCHPRLLTNSLRPGFLDHKRLTLLSSAGGRMP